MSVLKHSLISAAFLAGLASAQWVPGVSADIAVGSWYFESNKPTTYTGYDPSASQNSVLGSSIANGFADLLLVSDDVAPGTIKVVNANSLDITYLKSQVIATQGSYIPVQGEVAITYEHLGAMVVLRPLNGDAQSALVVLASTRNLYVCEIKQANAVFTITTLQTIDLPDNATQATGNYSDAGKSKRLALLSTSVVGTDTQYHLALSNPYYQNGSNAATGRVDFLTLNSASWGMLRPNKTGITGGNPSSMYELSANALFGIDVASAGDVDGDGVNDLAVLAPASTDYPNSALFIFLMQDASTPKPVSPKVLTGAALPWKQTSITSFYQQSCNGLSSKDLDGDGINEYVLNCYYHSTQLDVSYIFLLKLNNLSTIAHSTLFFKSTGAAAAGVFESPSLLLWGNDLQAPRLLTPFSSGAQGGIYYFQSTAMYNVNTSKNYAVVAGAAPDSVVNIDSLFYKSGQSGYTFKTLSGPASCALSTGGKGMLCSSSSPLSAGSWSAIEVTAEGTCAPYQPCKLKDTLHVVALKTGVDYALRMPHQVLPVNHEKVNIGSLRSLAFIRNYAEQTKTSIIFNGYSDNSDHATAASVDPMNTLSFSALANQKSIDTLHIRLQVGALLLDFYPQIHVVSPEKLVTTPFPATPGLDTLYGAVSGMYYALPLTNINGAALTYDVEQNFENDVEIVGNYLRIKALSTSTLTLRYVEEKTIKSRALVLSTDPKPSSILVTTQQHFNMHAVAAGMQINGLAGDYQVRVFGLNGQLLQEQQGTAYGSMLLPLNYSGVQVVRVQNANQVHILKVMR